jgi:hypothetical protein
MNTYLINAPHDQRIKTVENVDTRNIHAYSNPAYFQTKSLARDFGDIVVGDKVIICRASSLRYAAVIEEIVMATDKSEGKHDGLPVKILKGNVTTKYNKLSVAVFAGRLIKEAVAPPNLINANLSGFKQGAFAEKLTPEQLQAAKLPT